MTNERRYPVIDIRGGPAGHALEVREDGEPVTHLAEVVLSADTSSVVSVLFRRYVKVEATVIAPNVGDDWGVSLVLPYGDHQASVVGQGPTLADALLDAARAYHDGRVDDPPPEA